MDPPTSETSLFTVTTGGLIPAYKNSVSMQMVIGKGGGIDQLCDAEVSRVINEKLNEAIVSHSTNHLNEEPL
jgi:hypothetical protein